MVSGGLQMKKRLERIGIVGYYPNTTTISSKSNIRALRNLTIYITHRIYALQLYCIQLLEKKQYTICANTYII